MILNGNQRGGARQMGLHLLNPKTNDHVEIHEVSGFISQDILGALNESYAISKGTQCRQFMYSASFNPPQNADVSIETFEDAINRAENKLDLVGQPRIIVFHEKEGRRHAHCVWSRIIADEMKAVNMGNDHHKLKSLSKELFLENKWELPKGFIDRNQKNPLNFTREEWSQAQRTGQNPRAIKEALQDSWQASDNRKSFENALQERGYFLAKGDKKTIPVAVDLYGEVYALSRNTGVKKAELEQRLGKSEALPTITDTKHKISNRLTTQFQTYHQELLNHHQRELELLDKTKHEMTTKHRQARQQQKLALEKRWQHEEYKRSLRVRKGYKGLWDRLTGSYKKTRIKNEKETAQCLQRDRAEKQKLTTTQLTQRQQLQASYQEKRQNHVLQRAELIKGMDKHYQKIERQKEIRQLFEKERASFTKTIKNGPNHEPEI